MLVLLAFLLKQQSHPETDAEVAKKKVRELTSLIRSTEEELSILDAKTASGQDHSDAMAALLK